MAATMTGAGELTYASFPIDKVETDADGDLIVYGKASDGSIDSDLQIVDPTWMASAAQAWKESGANLRVQHNAQRDPAGVGLEVETDASGATWVKGLVVEPIAKKLVAKGALRAYSVGIARPTIERDATARGGRITAGELVEISLVDRPANKRCGIQLVKSADDGTPEYVNEVFGAEADIAKALGSDVTKAETAEKSIAPAEPAGIDTWAADDLSLNFTPNDMMRLMQSKFVEKHYDDLAVKAVIDAEAGVYKRDIDTATRRRLAADGKALPNLSYPIETSGDLQNAAHLARTGHGDTAAARKLIARRARELGVSNPLDDDDSTSKGTVTDTAAKADAPEAQVVEAPEAVKEAEPELTKSCSKCSAGSCDGVSCSCGSCTDGKCACGKSADKSAGEPEQQPVKKGKKKAKGPKKLPPWLNKPSDDGGGGSDDDDKGGSGDSACKHVWVQYTDGTNTSGVERKKCHTAPAEAAGVNASPMNPAPVGELMETPPPISAKGATPASASGAVAESMTPVPAHREPDGAPMEAFEATASMSDGDDEKPTKLEATMKGTSPEVAALLRFQHAGIDPEAGRLHDLTCPAYHPADVAKHHPFADFATAVDLDAFQRKAMKAAAGGDLSRAKAMQQVLYAASALKTAEPGWLNDCRLAAYKAFRDANPGPSTFPTPGNISPQPYNRPLVTDGHEASSPGHDGPNSSPQVATSAPNAHSFDRPPLASGHQSPSPSFMKASFEYPAETGRPVQLNYATMEKERARQALMQVHEHLSRQFPEACPMSLDGPQQPENHPVPSPAGIGKGNGGGGNLPSGPGDAVPAMLDNGYVVPAQAAAALKAEPEEAGLFADADIYKGFKKMRKKLGKKVLAGKMTVDEARTHLGRQFAQKGADEPQEAVQKSLPGGLKPYDLPAYTPPTPMPLSTRLPSPAQMSAAPAAPPAPVAAPFGAEDIEAAVTKAVAPLLEKIQQQDETYTTKLAEQQRVIDAIADQPDPSTAAFSGLAFNPVHKSASRPAAVPDIAESAARAQDMIRRNLQSTYYTHSSPAVREAAGQELAKLGWEPSMT